MTETERIYRLTSSGRHAWETQDLSVPEDYRRILWLMDLYGKDAVVGKILDRYPAKVLNEWLSEMETLGLIEPAPGGSNSGSAFFMRKAGRTPAEDLVNLLRSGNPASEHLTHTGAYIAADRLSMRPAPHKLPTETVVLVVEDDPDQLALAEVRVGMAGYKVRLAISVTAFLHSLLDDGAPDLLLLDVTLPDGNGFDLLAKIRRHAILGSLPIVMLTAENKPEDVGRGLLLGADGYIIKPYTKTIVGDVIRRVLRHDEIVKPAAGH